MVLRTLLLVEVDAGLGRALCDTLVSWRLVPANDPPSAVRAAQEHRPPVILLSALPGAPGRLAGSGALRTLEALRAAAPSAKPILVDGTDDRSVAVQAVALGAYDVYRGSVDPRELALLIERAWHRHELEAEGRRMTSDTTLPTLRAARDEAERRAVIDALSRSGGNLSAAARLLEVSRPTLYNLIRQHGIRVA